MRRILVFILFVFALLSQALTLQYCATPTPPRGGDVDSLGPVLILEESTPNYQTNFRPESIELTFDEWVELDPQQQILISPPIDLSGDNRPLLRRRTLVIPLEGIELLDSVTYVVNIGTAIKDLNEGNPTENLSFVFATGPELDTATVSGTLVDAFSGEPIDEAAFTLFANLADTAIFTQNPTYFAQTSEEGTFTVSNVRPGRYRAVGLLRNPGSTSYYADYSGVFPPTSVGFIDRVINVADGDNQVGVVRLSPVPVTPRINAFEVSEYGLVKITVNQPAPAVDVYTDKDYLRSDVKDTIRLFYREAAADTILIGRDSIFSDTLFFDPLDAGDQPALPLRVVESTKGKVVPGQNVRLVFNRPLESVDTSGIRLLYDTLLSPVRYEYDIDTLYPAQLTIRTSWKTEAPYQLEILPGAITDWYGIANADSITQPLNVDPAENFGNLTIVLTNLNPAVSYILRLIKGDEVITGTRRFIDKAFEYRANYVGLRPESYRVELIYDSNSNGRYDSGDLRFGLQPEVVSRFEVEPLRANWEVEKIIDLENN